MITLQIQDLALIAVAELQGDELFLPHAFVVLRIPRMKGTNKNEQQ